MRYVVLAVSITLAAANCAADLVKNPGFEEVDEKGAPVGWSGSPAVYQTDTEMKHSGERSLRFHNLDAANYQLCSQNVPLERDRLYEFSVWVKTEGLKGEDSGATICLEWWTKAGKYLGGSYPAGVKGDSDWTRVHAVSGRVPAEAERCNITVYCRKGMTGTAWFDDVELKRAFAPPMTSAVLWPNYRGWLDMEEEPQVELAVQVDTRDLDLSYDDLKLHLRVVDGSDKVWAVRTLDPVGLETRLRIALPPELPEGQYTISVRLAEEKTGRVIATDEHRLLRRPADAPWPHAYIDRHNRLIVDGEPFFPLGLYSNTGLMDDETLRLYSDSPFNCMMPYGTASREQMDLAHKYGIKVIYSIKDSYAGTTWCPKEIDSPEKERPWIEGVVGRFKDHPALLAWYLNDELPLTLLDRLTAHQRWVEELDPNHPTWVVLYQVREVRQYMPTFDVVGTDPYPIPAHPSRAGDWTKMTVEGVYNARPVWMVPQIFNWNCYRKDGDGRTPTFDEMRSMAWQCICEGAKGLVFYSFYDIRRDPETPFETQWDRVKRMAAEIREWTPAILSVERAAPVEARGSHIRWTARCLHGKTYLFAVNDDYADHSVTFRLPGWGAGLRRLGDEEFLPADGRDRVGDRLRGLDMQVYELVGE